MEWERVKRGELQLPSAAEVEAFLARRLGWRRAGRTVLLWRFRVRHGTAWQLEGRQETRRDRKLLPYVRLALAGAPDAELPDPCGCGAVATPSGGLLDRSHYFWVCPVARAVVASVEAQLPAAQRWAGERGTSAAAPRQGSCPPPHAAAPPARTAAPAHLRRLPSCHQPPAPTPNTRGTVSRERRTRAAAPGRAAASRQGQVVWGVLCRCYIVRQIVYQNKTLD